MLIYKVSNGIIIAKIPKGQPYDYLELESSLLDWRNYKIVEKELIELTDTERLEIRGYNRILTEKERIENSMLNELKPSYDEIQKAENTIEILSLLQEVMTNE